MWALALSAAAPGAAEPPWLDLEAPAEQSVQSLPAPWIEVRGRAGLGPRRPHDVVLALDLSASTWLASGVDVDGDGEVGRMSGRVRQLLRRDVQTTRLERTHFSSDPDDSRGAALVLAARRLVDRLDLDATRVGLVDFAESAKVSAPLGVDAAALKTALDEIALRGTTRGGQTNFAAAIRAGVEMLREPNGPEPRTRTLMLLSDGHPTSPPPGSLARAEARNAAVEAGAAGVRIFAFALGDEARRGLRLFEELAATTGGSLQVTPRPGDILLDLPRTQLAGLRAVRVRNRSSEQEASALRLFADGSFDAFVPLVPGLNRIVARVEAENGSRVEVERQVEYAPGEAQGVEAQRRQQEALRSLLEELRVRTVQAELQLEMERQRREQTGRELELEAER